MESSWGLLGRVFGAQPEWARFFRCGSPLPHLALEAADARGDLAAVRSFLEGRLRADSEPDADLAAWLRFHVRMTRGAGGFAWETLCAAEGCVEPGAFRCSACRRARYCSRACQASDRPAHLPSCQSPACAGPAGSAPPGPGRPRARRLPPAEG